MRRRDFATGLLLATAVQTVRAQEPIKRGRIAIVVPAGPVARINDAASRYWQPFWEELRRLGDAEGQNLIVEGYSGEGRPEGYAHLAREVASRNPDVIVAITGPVALAVRAATGTIPIVWIGVDPIAGGLVTSLAHPGGNITGVSLFDYETYAKRLQILKDTIPTASKIAFLARPINHLLYENFRTAGRIGEDGLRLRRVRSTLRWRGLDSNIQFRAETGFGRFGLGSDDHHQRRPAPT
jgi:putative ABC transport system substrate-binding protein